MYTPIIITFWKLNRIFFKETAITVSRKIDIFKNLIVSSSLGSKRERQHEVMWMGKLKGFDELGGGERIGENNLNEKPSS